MIMPIPKPEEKPKGLSGSITITGTMEVYYESPALMEWVEKHLKEMEEDG